MANVSDYYSLWLKAADLAADKVVTVTISAVSVETLHPRPAEETKKLVLAFRGKSRRLILNSTNANKLATLGGEDYTAWPGLVVGLKRTKYTASQDTIAIVPVPTNNGK